ncbi:protein translocase subunit secA [Kytococcus aerolatus]|uniref:Protein translocase subunit SecA n=1 Tax=Kytococcus aerolatus TaxID=592308 RepID=A0A212TZS2_9MICO|nr:protein translocase subunit secA [Kytococcus aerolatus]
MVRRLEGVATAVNAREAEMQALSDTELCEQTDRLKARLADGESLDALMPEAFATVREAAVRTLGKRHFDVQIMGGAALHQGAVAEMKTGEGKTLVATLPSYLNALTGKGVHVVTVNDYLAEYQAELMGRVHRFLGLETGVILSSLNSTQRREQYAKDITYGTNNEFGFDYLRDNMAWSVDDLVQREHHFAIVDEVDSILIDEARTPLIISGPGDQATSWYGTFAEIARKLEKGEPGDKLRGIEPTGDYEVDIKKRTVGVLESGIEKVEDHLGITNLYEARNTPLIGYLNNAIKAKELFTKDKDYVVMDGEVHIVDEHTGRLLKGRRYNDGVHQAIEAKEGVEVKQENQTLATVTLQNYFRMYDKLAGMTGTAQTEAAELHSIYKLDVIPIPTNRPLARVDQRDLVFADAKHKFDAVVEDIVGRHTKGQPVLVGTTSVAKSEYLSEQLTQRGVKHEVLNAKYHEQEAAIVAEAGRKGAVTVATNMAGRGTDIMLGGNPEFMAVASLKKRGLDPDENPEEYEAAWDDALARAERAVEAEHEEVLELGGLYVLGTERHDSRRIDNQLRGRSGRQGDPGESRFYLSLEDDLMVRFNSGLMQRAMASGDPSEPLEAGMLTKMIERAQTQVESQNFESRKNVLKYDDVLNRQREVIYAERKRVLEGADLEQQVRHFINDVIIDYVNGATAHGYAEDWDLDELWGALEELYPISLTVDDIVEAAGGIGGVDAELLVDELTSDAQYAYDARERAMGEEVMRQLERRVLLGVMDRKWREHLYEMDYLKEGIGLRSMAQRDPLVEYQREGYQMFGVMADSIKEEAVMGLFQVEPSAQGVQAVASGEARRKHGGAVDANEDQQRWQYTAPTAEGTVEQRTARGAQGNRAQRRAEKRRR